MSVVATSELDDLAATGEAARQPDGRHRGFGPGVDQPHLLDGIDPVDDLRGERNLPFRGRAERGALPYGCLDGHDHVGMGVPEDHRPPRADQVDVAAPVGIGEVGAGAARHEPRCAPHPAEGAYGRVDPTRRDALRIREQGFGRGRTVGIGHLAILSAVSAVDRSHCGQSACLSGVRE
jgi:hypothetical protein